MSGHAWAAALSLGWSLAALQGYDLVGGGCGRRAFGSRSFPGVLRPRSAALHLQGDARLRCAADLYENGAVHRLRVLRDPRPERNGA
jgi:hypothetical protein